MFWPSEACGLVDGVFLLLERGEYGAIKLKFELWAQPVYFNSAWKVLLNLLSRVYMKFSTAENFCNCAEFFTIQQCWITMVYIIFSTFTGFFLFQHLYIFSMRWWCTWNPALLNIFVFVLNFLALDFIVKRELVMNNSE